MTSFSVQSALLLLLAGIAFLGIGSLATAVLVRGFGARISLWMPRDRYRILVVLAALPVLMATVLLLSASLPSLVSLMASEFDHCLVHDDGHAHLCFLHPPTVDVNGALVLGLILTISYTGFRASLAVSGVVRALRVLGVLARAGEERRDLGITVLETSQPICLAAGLFRPRVLLSRGLLESLTEQERSVVLAHERTHVRRRHALVACMVRVFVGVHVPGVARWLVRELEISAEQTCDEEAAAAVGNRVAVASTILTVARAVHHAAPWCEVPVAVAFGRCVVEKRVESLLGDPAPPRSLRAIAVGLMFAGCSALASADELHHLTETLLDIIAH